MRGFETDLVDAMAFVVFGVSGSGYGTGLGVTTGRGAMRAGVVMDFKGAADAASRYVGDGATLATTDVVVVFLNAGAATVGGASRGG